uniref:Uncharacterized protein n=1 Tax=Oryza punctata TaxID=4537 RepID=A0A0E0LSJ4_ORYPU
MRELKKMMEIGSNNLKKMGGFVTGFTMLHYSQEKKNEIERIGFGSLLPDITLERKLIGQILDRYDKATESEEIVNAKKADKHLIRRFVLFTIGLILCLTNKAFVAFVSSEYLAIVKNTEHVRHIN